MEKTDYLELFNLNRLGCFAGLSGGLCGMYNFYTNLRANSTECQFKPTELLNEDY